MSEQLRSNIIIATDLKIQKEGFKSAHASITNIKKRLAELEREYVIKIRVDSSALKTIQGFTSATERLVAEQKKLLASGAGRRPPGMGAGGAGGAGSGGRPSGGYLRAAQRDFPVENFWRRRSQFAGGGVTRNVTSRKTKEGDIVEDVGWTHQAKFRFPGGGARTSKVRTDAAGNVIGTTDTERVSRTKTPHEIRMEQLRDRLTTGKHLLGRSGERGVGVPSQATQAETQRRWQEARSQAQGRMDRSTAEREVEVLKRAARRNAEIAQARREALSLSRRDARERGKIDKKVASQWKKEQDIVRFRDHASRIDQSMTRRGRTPGAASSVFNMKTGEAGEIREYYRVARDGLARYRVELTKVNTLSGRTTTEILRGARAAKYLGDSLQHTVEKVMMWTGATGIVFTAIRGLKEMGRLAVELESNTVFLARVGSNIRGISSAVESLSFKDKFEEDLKAARELTYEIVQLTTVIGGSATEAQMAASVFLRMGQTKEEALKSVTAALIAAKIAELEIGEAADYLSSAMLQFGVNVDQILPVLDSLNTLSNNYKVTTQDLLQAISRAGSVIASHNGRLTELAATTAIVAKRTSRTGTQIGNALKTIQSRLDRLEVRKGLSEKLSMSLYDITGQAKSLTQVLLELEHAMNGMNDAQRKDVTLKIAGIRQRNILEAALRDSVEMIIAENRALDVQGKEFDRVGSAILEAQAASYTLGNSLERLQATFAQIVEHARGPITEIATTFLNLVTAVLKLDRLTGGLLSKTAIWIGVIAAANMALRLMVTLFASISARASRLPAYIRLARIQQVRFNRELSSGGNLARLLGTRLRLIGGIYGQIATLAISAALVTAISMSSEYLTSLQGVVSLKQSEVDLAKQSLAAEQKKVQAVENTTKAVVTLLVARRKALSSGKSTKQVDEDVNLLMKSIGAGPIDTSNVEGSTEKSLHDARIEKIKGEAASKREVINALHDEISATKRLIAVQKRHALAYDILTSKARKRLTEIGITDATDTEIYKRVKWGGSKETDEFRKIQAELKKEYRGKAGGLGPLNTWEQFGMTDMGAMVDASKEYNEGLEEIRKKLEEIGELKKDVEEKRSTVRHMVEGRYESKKAFSEAYKLMVKYEEFTEGGKSRDLFESITGTKNPDRAKESFSSLIDLIEKLDSKIQIIRGGGMNLNIKESEAMVNVLWKAVDAAKEFAKQMSGPSFKDPLKYFNEVTKSGRSMVESYTKSLVRHRHAMGERPGETLQFEQMNAKRALLTNEVRDRTQRIKRLSTLGSRPGVRARIESERLALADSLTEKAKLESDYAIKLLDTEKRIVEEKKKATAEAAKTLGLLSEEDKLRVRAQAAFFARNPNRKMTFEEQFAADSSSVGIAQKYFGGHMEQFDPKTSPFGNQLQRAGFGLTPELQKAEDSVKALRGNATDAQILAKAREAEAKFREQAGFVSGHPVPGISTSVSGNIGSQANEAANMSNTISNLSVDVMNVDRMVSGIEKVVNASIADAERRFMDGISRIENNVKTRRPTKMQGP